MKNSYTQYSLLLFLSVCILYPLFSFRTPASDWFNVQIDSTITVQFPGQPTSQFVNGVQLYAVRTPEAVFMTMIMDQTPKPGQKPIDDTYSFYLGFMDSMIRNAKATLTDSTSFTLGTYKGMDFSYTSVLADGNKITRRNKAVLINNKVYSVAYTPITQPTPESQASAKQFLESVQLIK